MQHRETKVEKSSMYVTGIPEADGAFLQVEKGAIVKGMTAEN